MRSLADRVRAYEQQKARLADVEAKLKIAEKRAHTRRLIELGGLVEKAGLSGLVTEAIYGALLTLRDDAQNSRKVEHWTAAGARALVEEAQANQTASEAVVLTFPAKLSKEAGAALRSSGFRFNKVLQHWEGLARFEVAQELAASQGGTAHRVSGPFSAPALPNARVEETV